MEFNQTIFDTTLDNLLKTKESLVTIVEDINGVITMISKNWDSSASNQFTTNINSSLTKFQGYIDELDSCIKFMNESTGDMSKIENANIDIINEGF